ncbi:hypothetical protein C8F04DRAFT_1230613 [Mycena alexandri]|uniref:Uncharacterized protein n=1 Tax=Mycena alexandri TaxID=1745969 RepID=A0AAD6T6U1_9AGAR|nr:hypothetical protein C8F04DRAFT_1406109 [Mycena alexandri]KAJ7040906.1 hypothetical protein C8F04DRAFT_1230613 [Mycena alexandri]
MSFPREKPLITPINAHVAQERASRRRPSSPTWQDVLRLATAWRLLNTAMLLALGIYKAVSTYRGETTTSTTLDWILGVVWATISYWAGILEEESVFFTGSYWQRCHGADSEEASSTDERHPLRITPWRALNTTMVIALGVYKAAATYRGQSAAPATLDWILGLVWAIIAYWSDIVEQTAEPPLLAQFFQWDMLAYFRRYFTSGPRERDVVLLSPDPADGSYRERQSVRVRRPTQPEAEAQMVIPDSRLTAWRLLNTTALLTLGITKALATAHGQSSTPTTLDWLMGVCWVIISYWASFFERNFPTYYPALFQDDMWPLIRGLITFIGLCFLVLVGLYGFLYFTVTVPVILIIRSRQTGRFGIVGTCIVCVLIPAWLGWFYCRGPFARWRCRRAEEAIARDEEARRLLRMPTPPL